ncbi:MAG: ribose-5-phosphate isomerase RpiA [Alkalispirochaetaceae bacterium]
MDATELKRLVGRSAAERYARSGMRIGMGTGSTALWAIRRIGELMEEGKLTDILGVPTSTQSELECERAGIPIRTMNDRLIDGFLDLTIDGADEVDPGKALTKGGGGALLIEKVCAYNSRQVVIVVDEGKLAARLGDTFPVPLEVIPSARIPVTRRLEREGFEVVLREAQRKMGAVITDNGNILLDVRVPVARDALELEDLFGRIPGIVENGIFSRLDPLLLVGRSDGGIETL